MANNYSLKECTQIGRAIENDVRKRFDWTVKVTIRQDGSFTFHTVKARDRYDLYPGMTKAQADEAIMRDVLGIFRQHIPTARLTDYYQSGRMHYPTQ